MRLRAELKVPLGGFRGAFLAELEGCYEESCRSLTVRINKTKEKSKKTKVMRHLKMTEAK